MNGKNTDFNIDKRMKAAKDFETDSLKLMINSIYGKTIENLQKRIKVRLVNNAKDFLKYTSRPTYITHKIFGKDYAAIHEIKSVLILKKPIYVGFTVLDLSKWNMYDFHYNFIKTFFDAELLFTVLLMKKNKKTFMKSFLSGKICLTFFSNYSKDSK